MIHIIHTTAGLTLSRHLTTPIVVHDAPTLATAIRALVKPPAAPAPVNTPAQLGRRLAAARRRYL